MLHSEVKSYVFLAFTAWSFPALVQPADDVAANYLVNGSLQLLQDVKDAFYIYFPRDK